MKPTQAATVLTLGLLLASCPGLQAEERPPPCGEDLTAIQERGSLRLLTLNTPNTYFLYRGEQMGFEYELAKGLADRIGVDLEVVVVPETADPVEWLREGWGDLVGASLVAGEVSRPGVAFSQPYKHVSRVVLVREECADIERPRDLVGREIWVAEDSRQYWFLRTLELQLGGMIDIHCRPAGTAPEVILAELAEGTVEATVAETDIASLAMSYHGTLKVACALGPTQPVAWAIRSEDEHLLAAADEFLDGARGTFFFNHISRRYYDSGDEYQGFRESALVAWHSGRLTRFDHHIQKHADAFGIDWLLVAALMFEESSFNPTATSPAGAQGLLQLMPRTALSLGVEDLYNPDQNIMAGIRYLKDQYELFWDTPHTHDRLRFALASYNIGFGHVRDAQRLAGEMGLDSSSWDQVAEVLNNLSRREYFERTEHGYCRGETAVRYVGDVVGRWEIYRDYLRRHEAGDAPGEPVGTDADGCLSAITWSGEPSGA